MGKFEGIVFMVLVCISLVVIVYILAKYNYKLKRAILDKGLNPHDKRKYRFLEMASIILSIGAGLGISSFYTILELTEETFYFLVYSTLFICGGLGLVVAHLIRERSGGKQ